MNQPNSHYLSALNKITWQNIDDFAFPSQNIREWLLDQGSLSLRLRTCCNELDVDLVLHQWLLNEELTHDEQTLLSSPSHCLLRRVVLNGDELPWVIGSTLIPKSTTEDQDYDLLGLGEVPLGEAVFKAEAVDRDCMQLSSIEVAGELLYARRSRLWMNHKPMLVTELFLPSAPIYR
ncbi:chorismate lyase [Vibrio sp. RC27]